MTVPIERLSSRIANPLALSDAFERQRRAFYVEGSPSAARRCEWIDRAIGLLVDHEREIVDALTADFGHRSEIQSRMIDIMAPLAFLKDVRRKVRSWMKPQRRRANFPFGLLGGRAYLCFQPLGTIGIVIPWNAPFALAFSPLAYALAAGNRAMLKAPEQAPQSSALLRKMIDRAYDPSEVVVIEGDAQIAREFVRLPFGHLLFTGSAPIARHVMTAAAEHLVPVTLELGGKAPVIVGRSARLAAAVPKIVNGRIVNGGQVCMAPDYALVPNERVDQFIELAWAAIRTMYPTVRDNPDYTAMNSERGFKRLRRLVDEARQAGARVLQLEPELMNRTEPPYRFPPTLVVDAPANCALLREEIFGPILPVKGYSALDEAIAFVNEREPPLALYYFGHDPVERRRVLAETWAGGVTINDVMAHPLMTDLPFGGVGASGMGRYVSREGFLTFSNVKSVYEQGWFDLMRAGRPPYGKVLRRLIRAAISR